MSKNAWKCAACGARGYCRPAELQSKLHRHAAYSAHRTFKVALVWLVGGPSGGYASAAANLHWHTVVLDQ